MPSTETSTTISIETTSTRTFFTFKLRLNSYRCFLEISVCCTLNNGERMNSSISIAFCYVQSQLHPKGNHVRPGTQFVEELHELTKLLEINMSHASLKHPQTIAVVERSHAALTRFLKFNSNPTLTNWHRYLPLATFMHKTSHHTSIGCSPTVLFHGREPIKPLGLRFYSTCIQKSAFKYNFEFS